MGTIISLPPLLPDEDYRSFVFRYHLRSPYNTFFKSRLELIGNSSNKFMLYPQNLNRLVEHLKVTDKFLEHVIEEHTYFSFYRAFLTEEQHREYYRYMLDSSRNRNNKLTSSGGIQFISTDARYCPKCLEQSMEQFGECFLHRKHQFSFLNVCPTHEITLISHCPTCNTPLVNEKASLMLSTPCCINGHSLVHSDTKKPLGSFMSNFLEDINVFMDFKNISVEILFQKLLACLGNRGYIHFKGNIIYKKELLLNLIEFYSADNLKIFGLVEKKMFCRKFLYHFLHRDHARKNIPLYILIIRFLTGSASTFIKTNETYSNPIPFGLGPWKCINPICPHYNERVIVSCSVIVRNGFLVFLNAPTVE